MTPPPIREFKGQYRFLSNFWFCHAGIWMDGEKYPCVENAYQAAKTLDFAKRRPFHEYEGGYARLSAGDAKREGKRLTLRADWEEIKLDVMLGLVRQKFDGTDPILKHSILQTRDAELIEGNAWNDQFWGVCRGKGENHLGKILMQVRKEIRESLGGETYV